MSFLRPEDSFDSCTTPAVSKRRRPVVLSVDIGSPTYQGCLKVSRQDDSSRFTTANMNMSFNSDCLDRSLASAASSMRAQGMFSSRSLQLQSLHCSPLSRSSCGVLRAVETPAGSTSCSAASVLVPAAHTSFLNDLSQVVVKEWFQDAIACSSTVFHLEVDAAHCSQQVLTLSKANSLKLSPPLSRKQTISFQFQTHNTCPTLLLFHAHPRFCDAPQLSVCSGRLGIVALHWPCAALPLTSDSRASGRCSCDAPLLRLPPQLTTSRRRSLLSVTRSARIVGVVVGTHNLTHRRRPDAGRIVI